MRNRRAIILLLLMTAMFVAILRPGAGSPGGKEGFVGAEYKDASIGIYYCYDRRGDDKCLSVRPVVERR